FVEPEISSVVKRCRQTRNDFERARVIRHGFRSISATLVRESAMKESGNEVRRELKSDVVSADGSVEISRVSELVAELNIGERSLLACLGSQIGDAGAGEEPKRYANCSRELHYRNI